MTTDHDVGDRSIVDSGVDTGIDVVTGAFSYSGSAIAQELLTRGRRVHTLTGHPDRAPADSSVVVARLAFDRPDELAAAMTGATTLYNTYWVRFAHRNTDHERAVANSRILFNAARDAGIRRIVHVSITNPSVESPLPYFRGKAAVEQILISTGLSHAIVRPAILFGGNDVLINNIAWLLRHSPLFAIGGRGEYRIRGIHVDDLAHLCVDLGATLDNTTIDAVGPERPTFTELVSNIKTVIGSRCAIIHVPALVIPPLARIVGLALHDVLLTKDEYLAMADGSADTTGPASGSTAISTWLSENGPTLGRNYANELRRHYQQ